MAARVAAGRRLARQLAYWKKQLGGLAALELPPITPARGPELSRRDARVSPPRRARDEAHGARAEHEGVTLFMTMLAAFQIAAAR